MLCYVGRWLGWDNVAVGMGWCRLRKGYAIGRTYRWVFSLETQVEFTYGAEVWGMGWMLDVCVDWTVARTMGALWWLLVSFSCSSYSFAAWPFSFFTDTSDYFCHFFVLWHVAFPEKTFFESHRYCYCHQPLSPCKMRTHYFSCCPHHLFHGKFPAIYLFVLWSDHSSCYVLVVRHIFLYLISSYRFSFPHACISDYSSDNKQFLFFLQQVRDLSITTLSWRDLAFPLI